jgi:tetraacyldisaccharide 4'-kinase
MKALLPLSWLYGAAVATRNRYYDAVAPKKLPVPVVSVGNLTVGGSGKTPLVAAIARMLLARELPVAVVSRGYGREGNAPFVLVSDGKHVLVSAREGGDEPVELATQIPGLDVAFGADRFLTGNTLLDKLGKHVIVLDDGFLHRRLGRVVDLVCFDCSEPASSRYLLPAGRLREPLANLERADGVVLTGWSEGCAPPDDGDLSEVAVIRAVSRLEGFTRLDVPAPRLEANAFQGERLGLAVGIARPERVRESLGSAREIVHVVARRDHHRWREPELRQIAEAAKAKGATALLTTGKDAVKMSLPSSMPLPVYRIDVETEILDLESFETLLAFPPL